MLDINFIRQNKERVKEACRNKNLDDVVVNQILEVDEKRRKLIVQTQKIRQKRNELEKNSTRFIKSKGKPSQATIKKGKEFKGKLGKLEPQLRQTEEEFFKLMRQIPNLPAEDVPIGKDESGNAIVKKWGQIPKFDFPVKDHLKLGEKLDLIDVKRAAKLSGTRFGYLKNEAVLLEFALIQFALTTLAQEGFKPIIPPELINLDITQGLGYWEAGGNEDYYLVYEPELVNKTNKQEKPYFYLIGTAEHALVPMHKDEVLYEKDLPRRYIGFSTSFRREAGSYGKDTRGIFRVHQFDKVEMVSFTTPENSVREHKYLLSLEEKLVGALKLSYRVVQMCTGDLGFPAATKYDIECWIPSQEKYRETHSTSNCTDFQARRLNIKYRKKDNKIDYVHILNGTAFAIGRMIIAIIENNQTKEGWVRVPQVLQKYVGKEIIK